MAAAQLQPFAQSVLHLAAAANDPGFNATARLDPLMVIAQRSSRTLCDFEFFMPPQPGMVPFSCTDMVITFACALEKHTYIVPLPSADKPAWRIRDKMRAIGAAVGSAAIAAFPIVVFCHVHGEKGLDWYCRPLEPLDATERSDGFFIAAFLNGPGIPQPHATMGRGTRDYLKFLDGAVWDSPVPPPRLGMHWRNQHLLVDNSLYPGPSCRCSAGEHCQHEVRRTVVQFLTPPRDSCHQAILRNYSPFGLGLMSLVRAACGYAVRFSTPSGELQLPVPLAHLPHVMTNLGPPQWCGTLESNSAHFVIIKYPASLTWYQRLWSAARRVARNYKGVFTSVLGPIAAFSAIADITKGNNLVALCEGTKDAYDALLESSTYWLLQKVQRVVACLAPIFLIQTVYTWWHERLLSLVEVTDSSATNFARLPPPGIPRGLEAFPEWRSRVNNMGLSRDKTAVRETWRRALQAKHETALVHADPETLDLLWTSAATVDLAAREHVTVEFADRKVMVGCTSVFSRDHEKNVRHGTCRKCRRLFRQQISTISVLFRELRYSLTIGTRTDFGYVPLYSTNISAAAFLNFEFEPTFHFRTKIDGRRVDVDPNTSEGLRLLDYLLNTLPSDESYRGRACGPFLLDYVARCYPRGPRSLLMAFCCRMGKRKKCTPEPGYFDMLIPLYCFYILQGQFGALERETRDEWFNHFTVREKRIKMEQAGEQIRTGLRDERLVADRVLRAKCFTKMEKSVDVEWDLESTLCFEKEEMKPRVIISPNPQYLYIIGPYAHKLTKFLAAQCDGTNGLFYAGCSDPTQLRAWLRRVVTRFGLNDPAPSVVVGEGDVTNMDSHYSSEAFDFHAVARRLAFGENLRMEEDSMFEQQREVRAWGAFIEFFVQNVLPSGVPDTSQKHSLLGLLISAFSISYASAPGLNREARLTHVCDVVLPNSEIAVAGDDTLFFSDLNALGSAGHESDFSRLYSESWSKFGFPLKFKSFFGRDWLKCTFLAMRPIWTTDGYCWAVEPARRLKTMFWQLDCSIHPIAWARAVAVQNKNMGHVIPVFDDVLNFVLSFSGPTARPWVQPGYVWQDYVVPGQKDARTYSEFYETYNIAPTLYRDFQLWLTTVAHSASTPVLELSHPIFGYLLALA